MIAAAIGFAWSGLYVGITPASAQMPNINMMPEMKSQTPEEKERDAVADKAYRESLRKIPNQAANDPWGDVRGAGAAKPASPKPAPKATQARRQIKTDGTTN